MKQPGICHLWRIKCSSGNEEHIDGPRCQLLVLLRPPKGRELHGLVSDTRLLVNSHTLTCQARANVANEVLKRLQAWLFLSDTATLQSRAIA